MWNVIWCQWWDLESQEPMGLMRDLGQADDLDGVCRLYRQGHVDALLDDWGDGELVITDAEGVRIEEVETAALGW